MKQIHVIFSESLKWLSALFLLIHFSGEGLAQKTDTIYNAQGKLYQIITVDGNRERIQTFMYSGRLESDANFINGKRHGAQKEYFTHGGLKVEAHYHRGLRDGPYREYHQQGEIQKAVNYEVLKIDGQKKSVLHGDAAFYIRNGYLSRQGRYKKGVEEGTWKFYDQNGNISEEKVFEGGRMAGTHITYYPNGQVKSKAEVYEDVTTDNVHHEKLVKGWSKRYFENGSPEHFAEYKNGHATGNDKRWYEEGGLRNESELVDENRRITKYYDREGILTLYIEEKKTFKKGYPRWVKHGEMRNYENGRLSAITSYANGENHGKFEHYGPEGEILTSGRVHKGKPVGVIKRFYENGQLQSIDQKDFTIYWQGDTGIVENGWQKRWAENGQLTYATLKDMGQSVYSATYSEEGVLLERTYQIHGIQWSQAYYPKGELQSDIIHASFYDQKAVWYLTGVPQTLEIKSRYEPEKSVEYKMNGSGDLLSAQKNGEPFEPTPEEMIKYSVAKNPDFHMDNPLTGDFELNYGAGATRIVFTLKDSLPNGMFKLFRPDSSLVMYAEMEEGLSRGISYVLNSRGDTLVWQRKGERKEVERRVWNTDGSFREVRSNKRGVNLYTYETYPDGTPKRLADNERHIHKRRNPDGQLMFESYPAKEYENRTVHLQYHPNGRLRSKYFYEKKQRVGPLENYYENGQLSTLSYYENGELNGPYENYFDDGSLRSKGKMVDGKKEGAWKVSRNGKMEEELYINGKLQIKPPTERCVCIDTTIANSHYRSLNLLKYQLEYRKYKRLHFPFIQPLDSATYHSLFFKASSENSIDLIVHKPITLKFDDAGKNTLTINACHTTGYISNLYLMIWGQQSGIENIKIILQKADLRYSFENSIFEQGKNKKKISLVIENNRVEFNRANHIEFEDTYVKPCFKPINAGTWQLTSARIRLLSNVLPEKTENWFRGEPFDLLKLEFLPESFIADTVLPTPHGVSGKSRKRILSPEFTAQALNGIVAKSGSGSFQLNGKVVPFSLRHMWLTNDWATGVFDVDVSAVDKNGTFTIETESGKTFESNFEKLAQQLRKDGLGKLSVERYPNQKKLRIEFFAP